MSSATIRLQPCPVTLKPRRALAEARHSCGVAWANEKQIVDLNTLDKTLDLRSGSPSEIKRYGLVCTSYRSTGAIKDIRMRKL